MRPKSRRSTLLALVGFALAALLWPGAPALSEGVQSVFVTNFPSLFKVEGEVALRGPVHLAEMVKISEILVPPVRRSETTRLVDAGVLATGGFSQVVLSLHGQVKGAIARKGSVGALLLPDQEPVQLAFNEQGLTHFGLEVETGELGLTTSFFASNQPRHPIAFDRYRVFLFNHTDKTVKVDLYGYLTN